MSRQEKYREVVEAFNQIFCRIYSEVKRKGREAEFRSGLASFFAGASSYARLFSSISTLDDGSLPRDVLLANLDALDIPNPSDFLYQALNEYLFFQLFAAGEGLDPEDPGPQGAPPSSGAPPAQAALRSPSDEEVDWPAPLRYGTCDG